MSDLQCPARFLLVCGPTASTAETLRHERVAAVYEPGRGSGAAVLADALGLPVQVLPRPVAAADVRVRDGEAIDVLRELADLHRGETVVLVADGEPGERLEIAIDGDGVHIS